ncbi:alpha/beta hydrolase [Scytonema sp. UIC 10036]|uniref:alpha/beta hydrolase family protein n=1 Tax=Scytonema sp. UIC 10036 TaxID=2304196 RepID=UPI00140FD5A0|nr:alpha/beta hydrolase [Scytonema sp. UIC 10036]
MTLAVGFSPDPLFPLVDSYKTTMTNNGDSADIYFPVMTNSNINQHKSPIALFLPGSRVDTSQYSRFAGIVASYGFTVVVPERIRSLPAFGFTGLLPEASQINDVLAFMVAENSHQDSPIVGTIDTEKLVLVGHSFGGAVGLAAIDNSCIYPLCEGQFQRPKQLQAAAFFGTSTSVGAGRFIPIRNQGIPIALVVGSQDGLISPQVTQTDYDLIQEPPKALITVDGVNHYGITDNNNPLGARPDPNTPTLSQDKAIETIGRWSALFLRAYTLGDLGALDYVNNTGDRLDDNVTVKRQVKNLTGA